MSRLPCLRRWPSASGGRRRRSPWGLRARRRLAGAGLAGFHVGVEQHWWAGLAACEGGPAGETVAELRERLLNAPPARCDEVAWPLLGLSMAAWNGLLSLGLAGLAAVAALRTFSGVRSMTA